MAKDTDLALLAQLLTVDSNNNVTLAANQFTSSSTNTFTVGTAAYFVANGNVGIGNSAPENPITVSDKSTNPTIYLTASNSTYTPVYGALGYGVDPGLIMKKSLGTKASPLAVATDTRLGYVIAATTSDGNTFNNTLAINFVSEGVANATSQPTYLQFMTTSTDSISRAERMRISGNGNVGIGTSSPLSLLHLNKGSGAADIRFSVAGVLYGTAYASSSDMTVSSVTAIPLKFGTNNTERMQIDSSGNVGIGTSSPGGKFASVGGAIQLSGGTTAQEGIRIQRASGYAGIYGINNDNNAYNAIAIFTGASEAMRIDTSGNVGIGTSSPGNAKLNTQGFGSYRGNAYTIASFAANLTLAPLNIVQATDGTIPGISAGQNSSAVFSSLGFYTSEAERMRIDSSGQVGIGTASPGYKLDVQGTSGSSIVSRGWSANNTQSSQMHFMATNNGGTGDTNVAGYTFHCAGSYATHMHLRADGYIGMGGWSATAWRWYVNMGNGDMVAAGNVTAYSDPRLKEDIKKIDDPLGKVLSLNGVRFRWKQSSVIGHPGEHDYGVLANEVEAVMPELVRGSVFEAPEGDTYKTVSYDKLVPVLIEAIKEQQVQIDKLKEELTSLKQG